MLGTEALGVEPLATVAADEINAAINIYAAVYDTLDTELVYLIEIELYLGDSG